MKLKSHFYVTCVREPEGTRTLENVEGYTVELLLRPGTNPAFLPIFDAVAFEFENLNGCTVIDPKEFSNLVCRFFIKLEQVVGAFCTLRSGGSYFLGTDNAWMGDTRPECLLPIFEHSVMRAELSGGLYGNHIGTWESVMYLTGPNHLISPWHREQLLEGRSTYHACRQTFTERGTGAVLYDHTRLSPFDVYSGIASHSSTGSVAQVPGVGVVAR